MGLGGSSSVHALDSGCLDARGPLGTRAPWRGSSRHWELLLSKARGSSPATTAFVPLKPVFTLAHRFAEPALPWASLGHARSDASVREGTFAAVPARVFWLSLHSH